MKKASATPWVGGIGLALLTAASISAPLAKAADSTAEPPTMTVRFNDLNLGNAPGIAALYRRIVSAAEIVCRPYLVTTGSMFPPHAYVACRDKAIADALGKIDRPELTRYYREREGRPVRNDEAAARAAPGG